MPYPKLLKVGGPVLTGIGGVVSTSSLISKNANENPEEKLKTKVLSDEDPLIDEWKDRNEGEGDGSGDGSGGAGDSKGDGTEQGTGVPGVSASSDSGTDGKGSNTSDSSDSSDSEDGEAGEKGTEASGGGDGQEEPSQEGIQAGVSHEGAKDAEHVNAEGTAYGNIDRAMTKEEREQMVKMKGTLEDIFKQLSEL
nr:hypothetical protein [Mycoplasma haemocanis]